MDELTDRLEFESMLFGRYSLATRRGVQQLDRSAYTILSRLLAEGPMSIGQLSEALGLDASTLNRQTAAMMRAGHVERIPDPDGGIARKFRVTEQGAADLENQRAQSIRALDEILADWEPADVAGLVDYLRRFNTSIEEYHGRPWPRPTAAMPRK
ncbi:MarR family winged helix-turn-helix transcriptional regulator [Nocardia sp. CDC153]|uniref:MarR family winged helix-turn-helix transcriptional regulator n=1 Tax=Nocardia sp. CDC153 TaxID=3112167 RepID=UPI002DBCC12C|nr:MarR family winged helix-turn-helix transcriptional regulator [Nocardia sp. CDC153]MEC3956192.1 MarR family winged helix-turn-helix transcriptional regulator [Nocardia sp. CDC153]